MDPDDGTTSERLLNQNRPDPTLVRRKPVPQNSPLFTNGNAPPRVQKEPSISTTSVPNTAQTSALDKSVHTPIWLHKITLIALFVMFTLLWIASLLVWHFNRVENGFAISLSSNHLAWTYGPTAILVVVVNFWRQIDYYCKTTQPWRVMNHGFDTAAKTVLLDYLSPFQLTSLVDAVRNRHSLVVCSITGFIIIKLITLISTGLLIAVETSVSQPAAIQYDNIFDGTDFWEANLPTNITTLDDQDGYVMTGIYDQAYTNFSVTTYYDYLNILNSLNTTPVGFNESFVFQSFSLVNTNGDAVSRVANVDTFVPNVTCEPANLVWVQTAPNDTSSQPYSGFNLNSHSCPSYQGNEDARPDAPLEVYVDMTGASVLLGDSRFCWNNSASGGCPNISSSSTLYNFWRINCSSTTGPQYSPDDRQSLLNENTPFDFRIAMATLKVGYDLELSRVDNGTVGYSYQARLDDYDAFVCKVGYSVQKAELTLANDNSYSYSLLSNAEPARHLDNLTDLQLMEIVFDLYERTQMSFSNWNPLLNILDSVSEYTNGTTFDAFNLEQPLSQMLKGMAAMFMRESYTAPTTTTSKGSVVLMVNKLHMSSAIIFSMVAGFILMSILTLIVLLMPARLSLPWSHDTISGNAMVLASSKSFHNALRLIGITSRKNVKKQFGPTRFGMARNKPIRIELADYPADARNEAIPKTSQLKPRTPLSAKFYMILIMLILPLVCIAGLEALSQASARNNGVFTTPDQEGTKIYATRLLSAGVMFAVATLFNNFDFTVALEAPFSALASGGASARQSLHLNFLGKVPPHALYQSIVLGRVGSTFSIAASTIGSLLTIIVSGLWIVDNTVSVQDVRVKQLSTWQVDWAVSEADGTTRFNNIQHNLESLPATIWGDIVLPDLGSSPVFMKGQNNSVVTNTTSGNFTFTVPVLRPVLACEVVPPENVEVRYGVRDDAGNSFFIISAQQALPAGCKDLIQTTSNQTNLNFTFSDYLLPPDDPPPMWYGVLMDLFVGNDSELSKNDVSGTFFPAETGPANPPGCPSLGVFYGFAEENNTPQQLLDNATALVCYQKVQQLDADVTYVGPPSDESLDTDHPPVPQESSARYLQDPSSGQDSFSLRVAALTDEALTLFGPGSVPPVNDTLDDSHFFNFLLWGPNASQSADLLGVRNQQNLIDAIDRVYKNYMVNVIDLSFRQSLNDTNSTSPNAVGADMVQGTMQTQIYRTKIDNTSKLILQIMLAIMIVLGILADLLTDLRGILPKNPCSIAGTMVLLAGSKLVEEEVMVTNDHREAISEKKIRRVLDNHRYSLGWWRKESQSRPIPLEQESRGNDADEGDQVSQRSNEAGAPVNGGSDESEARVSQNSDESEARVNAKAEPLDDLGFGIDIGIPEVLGFKVEASWDKRLRDTILRRRRHKHDVLLKDKA